MGARFLNHGAAEAAIRASCEYANYLHNLAESLRHYDGQIGQSWQGDSYGRFSQELQSIIRRLEEAIAQSAAANKGIATELDRARAAEREEDRREERKKQEAASSA